MRISKVRKLGKIAREFHDLNVFPYNNYILENGSVVHNTGFSFSRLRSSGDAVASTGGVASGPVSFMKAFDASTDVIKQGGFRRGANMGILDAWHPDIEKFIDCKLDGNSMNNFNLSVAVDDEFMEAVETNSEYMLRDPRTKEPVRTINAKELFDKIVENAWTIGDPGLIFIDEINDSNPTPHLGRIESTNPCLSYDTALWTDKGVFKIGELVEERIKAKALTKSGWKDIVDWIKHEKQPTLKITFDCGTVIRASYDHKFDIGGNELTASQLKVGMEVEKYHVSEVRYGKIVNIEEGNIEDVYDITIKDDPTMVTNGYWSIDCGEQLLLPYESCNLGSIHLAKMLRYSSESRRYEIDYDKLKETVFNAVRFLDDVIDVNKYPLPQIEEMTKKSRKIGLGVMGFADALIMMEISYDSDEALTVARNFMESIRDYAFGASEELAMEKGNFPAFEGSVDERNGFMRNASRTTIAPAGTISIIADCSSGIEPIFDTKFLRRQADEEWWEEHSLYKKAKQDGWSQEKIDRVFRVSKDIHYEWHIKMQAVFQRYTENAVSKTINLSNDTTKEDVSQAFLQAYHKHLKGITIYRDGSRKVQVFTSVAEEKRKERGGRLYGHTDKIITGCGTAWITTNFNDDGVPHELFIAMGKGGTCAASQLEGLARMVSLALRNDIDIPQIVKQLRGIRCPEGNRDFQTGTRTLSCSDAISIVLNKITEEKEMKKPPEINKSSYERCPSCGGMMAPEEGCFKCYSCGHSKC